jgi:D-alanine-D-alanine ligase
MAPRRLSIAVVSGGPSAEAEVSRASGRGVSEALRGEGHTVVSHELDAHLAESLRTGGFDVVFPVAHGAVGEDGCLQGLLEVLGLPYVGSGVLSSALAMDKAMARRILAAEGLPVAPGFPAIRPRSEPDFAAQAAREAIRARDQIGPRLVVKPCREGSAIGVSRFDESAKVETIAEAIVATWRRGDAAIIEHFARGREVTCGVLDLSYFPGDSSRPESRGPSALPPTEIRSPNDPFYTYEARYAPSRSLHTCPAQLGDSLTQVVQAIATSAHQALGCRDLCRVDFIVGDGDRLEAVTLLEVNTMPGFTPTSLYPEAAAQAGYSLGRLTASLALAAYARGPTPRQAARPLPR